MRFGGPRADVLRTQHGAAPEGGTVEQGWTVGRVASWDGWCSPCARPDRPLVLTRSGLSGPRAWLAGVGDDERCLLLTCRVCGHWQNVPLREEDDPEVVLDDETYAEVAEVPARRTVVPAPRTARTPASVVLPAGTPVDLIALPV